MARGKAEEAPASAVSAFLSSPAPGAGTSTAQHTQAQAHTCSWALEGLEGLQGEAERGWETEWEEAEMSLLRSAGKASLCVKGRSLFGATFPWGLVTPVPDAALRCLCQLDCISTLSLAARWEAKHE